MAVGEFPPPSTDKPGFWDRFAAFALAATMAISGIVILVVSTPCGGAANPAFQMLAGACFGAAFEVFSQALSGKGITELNWLKIGVGALSGALSAIPIPGAGLAGKALGYVVAGLVGGSTDAAMMAIDGGSWQECLQAFGVGALKAITIRGSTQLIGKMVSRAGCFIAGTAIATLGGAIVIENLRVNYMVLSRNDMLGIVEYKPITDLYQYTAQELTHIELNNGTTIVSTSEHPYYVFNTGYIDAINLRAGDVLILADGKTVVVEKIQNELLEKPITVCNIAVADNRNYFVSEVGGDSDSSYILVHNSCAHQTGEWKKFRGDYWKAEGVKGSASEFASINKKNLALMTKGKAPFVIDGYKIELHHIEGIKVNFDNVVPLTRTQHQLQHLYESLFGGLK
jgi:hypothetical protein